MENKDPEILIGLVFLDNTQWPLKDIENVLMRHPVDLKMTRVSSWESRLDILVI